MALGVVLAMLMTIVVVLGISGAVKMALMLLEQCWWHHDGAKLMKCFCAVIEYTRYHVKKSSKLTN